MPDTLRRPAAGSRREPRARRTRRPGAVAPLVAAAFLALLASVPAGAIDLPGSTAATFRWEAASGPVSGYHVFVSRNGQGFPPAPEQQVSGREATVTGTLGESVRVRVRAFSAGGRVGPVSSASQVVRFVSAGSAAPLAVSPGVLSLTSDEGAAAPPGYLEIRNTGTGSLAWRVRSNTSWLLPSVAVGSTTTETDRVAVVVASQDLPAGTHAGSVTVSDLYGRHSETVSVVLVVHATPPSIGLSSTSVAKQAPAGSSPAVHTLTVRNTGGGRLDYTLSPSAPWLTLSSPSGSSEGESDAVELRFATAGLAPGTHNAVVLVWATGASNSPRVVSVRVEITQAAALATSTLFIPVVTRHRIPAREPSLTVRSTGPGGLDWRIESDAPWLTPWPGAGRSDGEEDTVAVRIDSEGLAPGRHVGNLRVTAQGAAEQVVPVLLSVRPPGADIDADGDSEGLLWSRSTGRVLVWSDPLGGELPDGVLTGGNPSSLRLLTRGDYDGDGATDLAWHNPATGAVAVCLLSGTALLGCDGPLVLGPGWTPVGSGDFDGDGRSDLAWREDASGDLQLCLMTGTAAASCSLFARFAEPWELALADVEGDGRTDVAAHHRDTGQLKTCATGPGGSFAGCTTRGQAAGPRLLGAADYDGDGRDDLLWLDAAGERLAVSFPASDDSAPVLQDAGPVPPGAEILASPDLDGDGRSEVMTLDPADGLVRALRVGRDGLEEELVLGTLGPGLGLVGSDPVQ